MSEFKKKCIPDQSNLRDYQKECIDIIDNCKDGSHLIVLPTGSGKTYVFSHIPRRGRVLILSHRDELVHQPEKYYVNEKVYDEDGNELPACTFGVEMAGEKSNGEDVVSASVQTMVHRLDKFDPNDFDMIITDEAHHAVAPSYKKIYEYFHPRIHLGFTATPDRHDKDDLHHIYDDILYKKDMTWGIRQKYLTDIECYQVDVGYNLDGVKRQMGDFQTKGLGDEMTREECLDATVEAYNKYHTGQTLIFAVNVAHAMKIAERIDGARVVVGDTPSTERAQIFKDFTERKFPCLVNVMVASEGTDLPLIETIILARPTQNASLMTQMIGRGLRPYPGKKALRLIDCVGISKNKPIDVGYLFGLNLDVLPHNKRKQLNGVHITEMKEKVDFLMDGPDSWIDNVRIVKLFKDDNPEIDFMGINFTVLSDNSLCVSIGNGKSFTIEAENELGETHLVYKNGKKTSREKVTRRTQEAINWLHAWLLKNGSDSRSLWDASRAKRWGDAPATDAQIAYIAKIANERDVSLTSIAKQKLTKAQASSLIEHILSKEIKHKSTVAYSAPAKKTYGSSSYGSYYGGSYYSGRGKTAAKSRRRRSKKR